MNLTSIHKISGSIIALFVVFHLVNHLVGLGGIGDHLQFMDALRVVYRNIFVESVLLLAVCLQIFSGVKFVFDGWRTKRGLVSRVQAYSGLYLAFFLLNHVGAILVGRFVLQLDTNYYFAIAGIHVQPFQYFFIPYYFLAVVAVFSHLGCALYWLIRRSSSKLALQLLVLVVVLGCVCSLLIVLAMSGAFYAIEVPAEYKSIYKLGF